MSRTSIRVHPGVRAGVIAGAILAGALVCSGASAAGPDMAVALRAGTSGVGLDYDVALGRYFSVRLGYSGLDYHRSANTSDVDYAGQLKLSMPAALVNWNVFGGGFHLSAGAVGGGTKLDVTGHPSGSGSYTLNGHTYTSADVGSLTGELKFGHSVSPYVGLGWGNAVGENGHWHFLVDLGAIYGGTPMVSLTAVCGSAAPAGSAECNQLQSDVQTEKAKLVSDANILRWYPVATVGVAYRF
jgi:hypothetical protein